MLARANPLYHSDYLFREVYVFREVYLLTAAVGAINGNPALDQTYKMGNTI